MATSIRLAHSRFFEHQPVNKSQPFDRVVSSVWCYDSSTNILTYGATVYKKSGKLDFWNKRQHKDQAMQRFKDTPIRVKFTSSTSTSSTNTIPELRSCAIDWYIAMHLIYQYGTHNKVVPDVRRVHHEKEIGSNFNTFYDPFYVKEHFVLGGPKNNRNSENTNTESGFPWKGFAFGLIFGIAVRALLYVVVTNRIDYLTE